MIKTMDHGTYKRSMKKKTLTELYYIIQDAREAIEAFPENQNSGFYQDEINYATSEIYSRRRG